MKRIKRLQITTPRGFALVVTVSLMVLLAVMCVGLLGLSAVALRSSTQTQAQAEAQANARLALMIAIGELQKYSGPDRAVTATSEILASSSASVAKPNTTGVWESWWDFNPNGSPDYSAEKTGRFRKWLVSSTDLTAPLSRDFVTKPWSGKTKELVGEASLGAAGTSATDADRVTAGLVPLSRNGVVQGSYAWHVSDESVKARINLYRDPDLNQTLAQKRALVAGHRPDPSVIKGPGGLLDFFPTDIGQSDFAVAKTSAGKVINLDQAELLDQGNGKVKPLRHDITPHSLGVMTDVRRGGLKQDLSSVFEMGATAANNLPNEFHGNSKKQLYDTMLDTTGVSDPNWSALSAYYNSFRSLKSADTNPTFELEQVADSTDLVPAGFNPAPVIAKVDTIFSLVPRPLTDVGWIDKTKYDYFVDLIFTPVVILHNPYNVSLSFQKMEVEFRNLPVAFNFTLASDGSGPPGMAPGSKSVVPGSFDSFSTMAQIPSNRGDKKFVVTIADWADRQPLKVSKDIAGPIVMKPGQTLVCGPQFPADSSFQFDANNGYNGVAYDWTRDDRMKVTEKVKAGPSFTPGLGFEITAVMISNTRHGSGMGSWCSYFMMRDRSAKPKVSQSTSTDRFYVEFKVQRPFWYTQDLSKANAQLATQELEASFAVTASLQAGENDNLEPYSELRFDYGNDKTLNGFFNDRVYRFPPTGYVEWERIPAPSGVTYAQQYAYVQPFAIFSAYARTTNGGVYETGLRNETDGAYNVLQDGRLAGKPFLFHNPTLSTFTMDLATQKPGVQAYELNFQPFLSKGNYEDYMDVDATNRVPALSGNKTTTGIKSGSYFELPSGPMQTIADFRRSNALTTSYLPSFVQPVANSLLHPLMSPDKVIETNRNVANHALLDHSVLANHALYDRFYFSTFATRGTTKPDIVFERFMNGDEPLDSQAFLPYLPGGKSVADAKSELYSSGMPRETAYQTAAEYQMVRGPFNVNSTNVQAWKAKLASLGNTEIQTLWARTAELDSTVPDGAPITAMTLLNGGAIDSGGLDGSKIDNERTNEWNGYRVLTEAELQILAEKIVEQVRERGPFLSMSEFVNRQVGPAGPRTLKGALEAAIGEAEINEQKGAEFPATFLGQVPITETNVSDPKFYSYKTPQATTGNPAAGAPGWVSQGDLLRVLEPAVTVRGDTFVIRTYGEAQDASGNITARAYAEAVVQRVPDYVDPADRPSLNAYTEASAKAANRKFGRRFQIVSFQWLSQAEI